MTFERNELWGFFFFLISLPCLFTEGWQILSVLQREFRRTYYLLRLRYSESPGSKSSNVLILIITGQCSLYLVPGPQSRPRWKAFALYSWGFLVFSKVTIYSVLLYTSHVAGLLREPALCRLGQIRPLFHLSFGFLSAALTSCLFTKQHLISFSGLGRGL